MEDLNTIECPHCGAQADVMDTRCPKCGRSFYPEEETSSLRRPVEKPGGSSLFQRWLTMALIGALAGGGMTLAAGPQWAWLVPAGALVLGLASWLWARKNP